MTATVTEVPEDEIPADDSAEKQVWLAAPFAALAVPTLAVVGALTVGAVMLLALGANPLQGYAALVSGSVGSWDNLADTAIKSMPLMLVGVGICIAFRAGVINIGGDGQIIAGAILSTTVALALPNVPRILLVPIVLIAGAIGGGIWGAIPGALKAYAGVNEILSTIMMNIVAGQFLSFLLQDLPILPGGTRLHLGFLIALLVAVLGYYLLFKSALGVRLRADGHNPHASRYAGMPVKKSVVQALAFSGADLVRRYSVKTPNLDTPTRHLSGGNIQKVVIAREFSCNATSLVVAQSTRGVDIGAAEYIHGQLLKQRSEGAAILLISEDLDEVRQLSDRIVVLLEGEIMGELPRGQADVETLGLLMSGVTSS